MKYGDKIEEGGKTFVYVGRGSKKTPLKGKWGDRALFSDYLGWLGGYVGDDPRMRYFVELSVFNKIENLKSEPQNSNILIDNDEIKIFKLDGSFYIHEKNVNKARVVTKTSVVITATELGAPLENINNFIIN